MSHFYSPNPWKKGFFVALAFLLVGFNPSQAQNSVAREWNEVLLEAIRDDFARPTVHARNLFHTGAVMYDAWAVYDDVAQPYFLNGMLGDYPVEFHGVTIPDDIQAAQEEAISYAVYRLLSHRFIGSPGEGASMYRFDMLMSNLGYDMDFTSTDYVNDGPAALGNYLAEKMVEFGYQDGSNEQGQYGNLYYSPVNVDLIMDNPGNPNCTYPNRWQPLWITNFIDQSGNPVGNAPEFLSPEWGDVVPFSMTTNDLSVLIRENDDSGQEWNVWMNPETPPQLIPTVPSDIENPYKWGNAMVAVWSGHLDPSDGVMIDISPGAIGNISTFPETVADYPNFYNFLEGGDAGQGWDMNPVTGLPYESQVVPRGDYGRILAEFWADGPSSETPPGHWFTILNYVTDHELETHQWDGVGDPLNLLEWDVKSYFVMGGAMHDCAVASWSIKGFHDYIRPVSAIRYMADKGQSTDPLASNYHPGGIPLVPGHIESVELGDPLAGPNDENVGKIKLYAWKGPNYINNPSIDEAGVDWILAEEWWPYQRPSFVTPPFAGYVSGHSTYSRAAAEVMTLITGDEFFPGGMGIFDAPQNEFLVFEEGPSMFIELQWATYRDASDQCSLSRIWGGIHPPADDIPGRKIGLELGPQAFDFSETFFNADPPRVQNVSVNNVQISDPTLETGLSITVVFDQEMDVMSTPELVFPMADPSNTISLVSTEWTDAFTAVVTYSLQDVDERVDNVFVSVKGASNISGSTQNAYLETNVFSIDTENPVALSIGDDAEVLTDASVGAGALNITVSYDEAMDVSLAPSFSYPNQDASNSLTLESGMWSEDMLTYDAVFTMNDANEEVSNVDVEVASAIDLVGNAQIANVELNAFSIDSKNPGLMLMSPNPYVVTAANDGAENFSLIMIFDEMMDVSANPVISFPNEDPADVLTFNAGASSWINSTTFVAKFDVSNTNEVLLQGIDVTIEGASDSNGNAQVGIDEVDQFDINTVVTGIEENQGLDITTVYPNPVVAGNEFVISLGDMSEKFVLQVYNTAGQVVYAEQMTSVLNNQTRVSTEGIAAGSYFVHIQSDKQQFIYQLEVVD